MQIHWHDDRLPETLDFDFDFECTRADQLVDNLLKIKVMTVTEMPIGTTTLSRQCYLNGYSWK